MNKRFRLVMEFTWMAVFVFATGALTVSVIRHENHNIMVFSIISLIALFMYLFRRNQRKKS